MTQQKNNQNALSYEQLLASCESREPVLTLDEMKSWADGSLSTITTDLKRESIDCATTPTDMVFRLCPAPVWLHIKAPIFGKFALNQTSLESRDI